MTTVLHIDSSPRIEGSVTRELSTRAVERLRLEYGDLQVIRRDLAREPLPHTDTAFVNGLFATFGGSDGGDALAISNAVVDEFLVADVIVIGAPMYNYGVTSLLKAWIDHVVRAGRTFAYTPEGPKGFGTGKRVIVLVGSGGSYAQPPMDAHDHLVPHLRSVFWLLGISDIDVVRAENQVIGADPAAAGLEAGRQELDELLAPASTVAA